MKRWLLAIVLVLLAAAWAMAVRYVMRAEAKKGREAGYESALQVYSQDLKPGLTRKAVEDYLRARSVGFQQRCCLEERGAFADLVKVGQEDAPWHCGATFVYIAFEFAAPDSNTPPSKAGDTDTLKNIRIFRHLEGCL